MRSSIYRRGRSANAEGGFTLLEVIVAATILSILTMMALPLARVAIQREKEKQLRPALWEMRDAIDNYKMAGESASVKGVYSRENSWDRETFSSFAINSKLRIETFLFPRSTSARKLRSTARERELVQPNPRIRTDETRESGHRVRHHQGWRFAGNEIGSLLRRGEWSEHRPLLFGRNQ